MLGGVVRVVGGYTAIVMYLILYLILVRGREARKKTVFDSNHSFYRGWNYEDLFRGLRIPLKKDEISFG